MAFLAVGVIVVVLSIVFFNFDKWFSDDELWDEDKEDLK